MAPISLRFYRGGFADGFLTMCGARMQCEQDRQRKRVNPTTVTHVPFSYTARDFNREFLSLAIVRIGAPVAASVMVITNIPLVCAGHHKKALF
jgi:hypothetical protein